MFISYMESNNGNTMKHVCDIYTYGNNTWFDVFSHLGQNKMADKKTHGSLLSLDAILRQQRLLEFRKNFVDEIYVLRRLINGSIIIYPHLYRL